MPQIHAILRFAICTALAFAFNLPSLQNLNITSKTAPLYPANQSLAISPSYSCTGGPEYGDAISLSSCEDAADSLLDFVHFSYREILSFGDRRGAAGKDALVPLPYISISCT